jgi:transcriptional regulator with XRE-family HTH domain
MSPLTATTLKQLMRKHRVTIRELSRRMGITQRTIRAARNGNLSLGLLASFDWWQAITGAAELTPRMRAQLKQIINGNLPHGCQ